MIESRDTSDLRKFRTEIPNIVLERDLSPFALALYVHLKKTAGQNGACWKSTRTLAKETKISAGKICDARSELEESNLIHVERPTDQSKSVVVTIVDVWEDNFRFYIERSRHEHERSPHEHERSPHERNKEPYKKEPYKNSAIKADAPQAATSPAASQPNPFTYFCDKMQELGLEVVPDDRKRVPGNLTRVKNKHGLNEFQVRRLITEMVEARLRDYPMSPQEAWNKMNGIKKGGAKKEEPVNPHGEEGIEAKDKPYPLHWYCAAYDDVAPDVIEGLIKTLASHAKIVDWLEGKGDEYAQAAEV